LSKLQQLQLFNRWKMWWNSFPIRCHWAYSLSDPWKSCSTPDSYRLVGYPLPRIRGSAVKKWVILPYVQSWNNPPWTFWMQPYCSTVKSLSDYWPCLSAALCSSSQRQACTREVAH